MLAGLLRPDAGRLAYALDGAPADFAEVKPVLGYLPQQSSLYPDLSCLEHLDFFRELYRIPSGQYAPRRDELLRIARLERFKHRRAGQLSGGMYKKLGVICVLLQSPRAILLDEPTNGVDPVSRRELWELFYRFRDQGMLVIVSTSYMDEAERCSRVHLLDRGRLLSSGEPRDMLERSGAARFEDIFLRKTAGRAPLPAVLGAAPEGRMGPPRAGAAMTASLAVEAEGLTVAFGDFKAVDGVTFSVLRGEVFGFLGANGAGKTTTIRALCGLLTPTAGRLTVAGVDVATSPLEVKSRVGYMSQKFTLYADLTVAENLAFAADLRKMPARTLASRTRELVAFVGLDVPRSSLVRDLPAGAKQHLSLIAATLHDPEVVFLDEPTAGVDPAARERFWRLIERLSSAGKTVFVTTHYMQEAEQCGRVALMHAGKIIALDSPEALKSSAFPEPVFELEPPPGAPTGWLEALHRARVGEVHPYGMRYHVAVGDVPGWERCLQDLGPAFRSRPIRPSLEDVFIRFMEAAA
ncbi:MAG: ABC transporter ATP-binding protein [Elusimicrobia bacterium]|nr:ABC transporter ATP-binding protein [Elusimicrobiota bacterium]